MKYKIYVYRNRKLFLTKETNNNYIALEFFKKYSTCTLPLCTNEWTVTLYYKDKRLKFYNYNSESDR